MIPKFRMFFFDNGQPKTAMLDTPKAEINLLLDEIAPAQSLTT